MNTKDSSTKIMMTITAHHRKRSRVHAWIESVRDSQLGTFIACSYYALLVAVAIAWLILGDIHDVGVTLQVILVASAWAIYPAVMKLRAMMAATPERKAAIEKTAGQWMTPANCVLFVVIGAGYLLGPTPTRMTSRIMGGMSIVFGILATALIFKQWQHERTAKRINALLAGKATSLGVVRSNDETDIDYWRRIVVASAARYPSEDSIIIRDVTPVTKEVTS